MLPVWALAIAIWLVEDSCLYLQNFHSPLILWKAARSSPQWCLDKIFCSSIIAERPWQKCGEGKRNPTDKMKLLSLPTGC